MFYPAQILKYQREHRLMIKIMNFGARLMGFQPDPIIY